jgi:cell division protein FtsI/penicillin-binding protein 2
MGIQAPPVRRRGWPTGSGSGPRPAPRLRPLALLALAGLLGVAIWGRLAYWQLTQHGRLAGLAESQYSSEVKVPASRGIIYDRELNPLAINNTVYSVFVSPQLVPSARREMVADRLALALGRPADQILAVLRSDQKFAYLARRVPKEKADELRRLQLDGVGLEQEEERAYLPGGSEGASLAANLLGYVDFDGHGQYGVESFYQSQLAGRTGYTSSYRDLAGREIVIGTRSHRDPVNGSNLILSLDSYIQYIAEQQLAAGVRNAKAESGSVVIMDPKTGGIIAWADYPAYNANDFQHADLARVKDSIVSDLYEPGSVMKVPTLCGALNTGFITPGTVIWDPGYIRVGSAVIRDWDTKNHGNVTMSNVLEKSLNVGAIKAMQMEGPDNFYNNLLAFGFGNPTGMDVAGEVNARLRPLSEWRDTELATTTFGQGIAANMIQMAAAINVVANDGRYAPPHVVERIGGQPNSAYTGPQRQVISSESAAHMKQMMASVVQRGSGWTSRVAGYELNQAGKTGTSQMVEDGRYSDEHLWASYVGFMPLDNPRFTMLVVVRKPNNGSFDNNEGYFVSAPIWKGIASAIAFRWRIPPEPKPPR